VTYQRSEVLLVALEAILDKKGNRGPEWFESLADSAEEAMAVFNREQELNSRPLGAPH
jgi:hypothetical protein